MDLPGDIDALLELGPVAVERLLAEQKAAEAAGNKERAKLLAAAVRDCWATPKDLFARLHHQYGFTVDCCAERWNAKLPRWFGLGGEVGDAFAASWADETWFCNPPFSQIERWLRYAWSWYDPTKPRARTGVMLMPATRAEQAWWQTLVEPFRDKPDVWQLLKVELSVSFLPGRTHYEPPPGVGESSPRFGSCLLTWRPL